jgi:hypothetical protein
LYSKLIASLLAASLMLPAQQAEPAASKLVAADPSGLKIVVVEGEGATNQIRSRSGVAPVVEVRDADDKPVPGAEVYFQLPLGGPSGYFNGWLRNQTVKTDKNGRAAATGYTSNDEEGRFNIKVSATAGTRTASGVIAQSNVRGAGSAPATAARSSSSRKTLWTVLAVAGAAAVGGGIYAGTRGDSPTAAAAAKSINISAGAITVGGPR